jgi:ribosomal protein S21
MAVKVLKDEKESNEKLQNRFNKKVQGRRIVNEVKDRKHFKKKPTKRKIRDAAIMREFHRAERKRRQHYS